MLSFVAGPYPPTMRERGPAASHQYMMAQQMAQSVNVSYPSGHPQSGENETPVRYFQPFPSILFDPVQGYQQEYILYSPFVVISLK